MFVLYLANARIYQPEQFDPEEMSKIASSGGKEMIFLKMVRGQ